MFDTEPAFTEPKRTGWRRLIVPLATLCGLAVTGALAVVLLRPSSSPAPRPHQEPHITHIQLPPPPPPPPIKPPPPEPTRKQLEKPKEQVASLHRATVPKAAPKAPSPPAALTTSITGPGPGTLAAGNGGGGDCIGSGCGTGDGGGGDNDAYYSSVIRSQTLAALQRDEKLRFARYKLTASIVLDASGHIASATVQSFDGPPDIEQEVRRTLLTVGTNDTPPADVLHRAFSITIFEHA
jgi:hypothetical protein